jgi:hypothetical protein
VVAQQAQVGVGVDVDETRRQCQPGKVEFLGADGGQPVRHGGDAAAGHGHVAGYGRRAGAVVDGG